MSAIEESRGFFGIIIPAEIVDSAELTVAEKFIYGFVASFTKACFLSNEAIADRTGVSEHTVSRAINNLSKMGYLYVEFIKGNSAARRIYSVFDNPKKLKYLASKGMFDINREGKQSFAQGFAQVSQKGEGVSQIGNGVSQNGKPQNGGEVSQNGYHRYRINNIEESAGARGKAERPFALPRRADFATHEEWERAMYNMKGEAPS